MLARTACLLALALAFAGCATNLVGIHDGESALANLSAANKGLVLIDTDLHDRCGRVLARVAHPDENGHYVVAEEIALKRILNRPGPTEVQLPAGDYGIVELDCESGPNHQVFMARATKRGNLLNGDGAVFDRPIATFSVRAGEFVDVGSLRLPSWSTGKFFGPQAEFKAYATPIEDAVVAKLALAKPAIYAHRVQRLMITPDKPPGPDPFAKPAKPHPPLPPATDPDGKG
jgi:hypothetical protein